MIHRSGYFKTDTTCPGIGYIVFSDGDTSQPLATKRHALEIGEALVGIKITDEEWLIINQQIHESSMISKDTRLESLMNTVTGAVEEIMRVVGPMITEIKRQQEENRLADWWKKENDGPPNSPFE